MKKTILFLTAILLLAPANIFAKTAASSESSGKKQTQNKTVQAEEINPADEYTENASPLLFEFKYAEGDSYRILSTVNEDVYVNRKFHHQSSFINRISVDVTEVDSENSAEHNVIFMTTEEAVGNTSAKSFKWAEEYRSIFLRDKYGVYKNDSEYFMPTVRNVPSFPKRRIKPGDTWSAEGIEVHDLRQNFKIQEPYKIPFTAEYTYLGESVQNPNLKLINVKYSLYSKNPVPDEMPSKETDYPVLTMGYSNQIIFWDYEKGNIDHYRENFRIVIESASGNILEVRGKAHSEVTDFVSVNNEAGVEQMQQEIDSLGLSNVTVKKGEKGLTLSVEDIKFKADSAELIESEKIKLQKIAEILSAYADNDILVAGHTALAGSEKIRQLLSEERADTVALYLIQLGVRDKNHIFTQGFGATKPIAPNTNEEGKAKNRRVEIILLDK